MSDLRGFIDAVKSGQLEDVKRRFKKEYVNATDEHGLTALHYACNNNNNDGSGDIVRYLVSEGWNIEAETDTDQCRSIHYAVLSGDISVVTALIEARCILDCRTKNGDTPIDLAMKNRGYKTDEFVRLLRSAMVPKIERQMMHVIASLNCKKDEMLLRQGAFGRVIRCTDDEVGYNFAVKKITGFTGAFIDEEVKCLKNEIKIYNKLEEHDRIVKYYGTHSTSDAIYIFMECMEGGSIADYLAKHGALTSVKIAHYTKQVLHGLDFLHRHCIIHRDIKGAHILRDAQDDIKLCGFGRSRYLQNMEMANTECGTPYWMAPEVINGEEYRFSADIWSLGATVVEMVTGTHPYPRLESMQALFRIGNTRKLEYDIPESMTPTLQSFIDQMLVPDPMERASIDALLASDFIRDAS